LVSSRICMTTSASVASSTLVRIRQMTDLCRCQDGVDGPVASRERAEPMSTARSAAKWGPRRLRRTLHPAEEKRAAPGRRGAKPPVPVTAHVGLRRCANAESHGLTVPICRRWEGPLPPTAGDRGGRRRLDARAHLRRAQGPSAPPRRSRSRDTSVPGGGGRPPQVLPRCRRPLSRSPWPGPTRGCRDSGHGAGPTPTAPPHAQERARGRDQRSGTCRMWSPAGFPTVSTEWAAKAPWRQRG
jgi:hypothetical protein